MGQCSSKQSTKKTSSYSVEGGEVIFTRQDKGNIDSVFVRQDGVEGLQPLNKENAHTVLHASVNCDNPELAQLALGTGVSANSVDAKLLKRSIAENNSKMLKLLLDSGASPDGVETGDSLNLLSNSLAYDNADAFKLLLKAGANPNSKNPNGTTMLETAYDCDKAGAFKALLKAGAKLDNEDLNMGVRKGYGLDNFMPIAGQHVMEQEVFREKIGGYLSPECGFNQVKDEIGRYYSPESTNQEPPQPKNSFVNAVLKNRRAQLPPQPPSIY